MLLLRVRRQLQADCAYQARRDAKPAGSGRRLDGDERTARVRAHARVRWRLVGRHDNRLLSAVRCCAVCRAGESAAQLHRAAFPRAARTVDPARVHSHQHLPDGQPDARHVDPLRRLDDARSVTA